MAIINKEKPVLVTGATGYVAGWLIKRLLEEGLTVHATVRDPQKKDKIAHLDSIAAQTEGKILYFKADLLTAGSFDEAMQGCELVFHTASPFVLDVKDAQRDLIDPAVKGTEHVLEAANRTESVKRVVLTSSCAAIYTDAIDCLKAPNGILTEEVWNTTASLDYQPYSYSKTLAEKRAWELAEKQHRWDLVAINPCLVLGRALNMQTTTSESFNLLKQIGDGTLKWGAPRSGIGVVDVRDVAQAHFMAGFTPEAKGRYITAGHNTDLLAMAMTLLPKYGAKYPIPRRAFPKWLLWLVGPIANKVLSRRFISNNVNYSWQADNSKIRRELQMSFRPLQETMEDSFQAMIDEKILPSK